MLNNNSPQVESRFEVINCGVEGYNTFQERVFLINEGLQYEPDLVIVCFVLNDLEYTSFYTLFGPFPKNAIYPVEEWSLRFKCEKFLAGYSYFFCYLINKFYRLQNFSSFINPEITERDIFNFSLLSHEAVAENNYFLKHPKEMKKILRERKWNKGISELRRIVQFSSSHGIDILLVNFPYKIQVENPSLNYPQLRLSEFCKEESVRFFDLLPLYKENKDLDFLHDDYHPTKLGHRLIADALFQELITQNLLSEVQ